MDSSGFRGRSRVVALLSLAVFLVAGVLWIVDRHANRDAVSGLTLLGMVGLAIAVAIDRDRSGS
jgi:hypothetical protein